MPNQSSSSTRSNSVETPTSCSEYDASSTAASPSTPHVPPMPGIIQRDGTDDAVSTCSPPPSYEYVLEETRMKARADTSSPVISIKRPEIMHKSSKELYKAVAKQFGVTCKMSDECRCFDCQSHYFDCDYEQNEQMKTDGGLGAGSPMFISEVIHGTACSIL